MLLEYLAQNEVKSLVHLHQQDFVVKHCGLYFDVHKDGQVKYVIVTEQYPENWTKLIYLENNILIKVLRQILIALQIM